MLGNSCSKVRRCGAAEVRPLDSGHVTDRLLEIAFLSAESHAGSDGVARTPIPGVTVIRETIPGIMQYAINRPLIALVPSPRTTAVAS